MAKNTNNGSSQTLLPGNRASSRSVFAAVGYSALGLLLGSVSTAQENTAPPNGTIGFALTDLFWSVYQTPNAKEECPQGFNDGPREQYDILYPDPAKRTVVNTRLAREIETWHPTAEDEDFVFHSASGPYSYGLNLDGKVDENDYQHPNGEKGIDNQVYRAVGCIIGFRGPDGVEYIFQNKAITDAVYNRTMFELTGVDDLQNDDHVVMTVYRGMDKLLTDATGDKVIAGGSQRIDTRWGRRLIQQTTGKIVDGVLTTEPLDEMLIPWMNLGVPTFQLIRDMRVEFKLTPTGATGLIAGYADVDTYYKQLIRNDSTHHLSNGQISGVSLYKALRRFADAYPDQNTGANTAISTSLDAKLTQVYIVHPDGEAAKAALLEEIRDGSLSASATGEEARKGGQASRSDTR